MTELLDQLSKLEAKGKEAIVDSTDAAKLKELQAELTRVLEEVGIQHDKMPFDEGIQQQLPDQKIR